MLPSETQCQCSAQPNDETASNQFPIHDGFHNTNMNLYSYMTQPNASLKCDYGLPRQPIDRPFSRRLLPPFSSHIELLSGKH